MEILESQLSTTDDRFRANDAHNRALAADLRQRLARIRQGGRRDDLCYHRPL